MGHSCRTLLWDTPVGHSSYETSSKSHAARLQDERFVRDFLQKSRVKSQQRAFRTRLPPKVTRQVPKRAFRARLPPKVTCQVPKTSVFSRLPQKLTCQSLQNERSARGFLQKSSGNTHRSTHITQPCQTVSRFQPLQRRPLTRQSQCDSVYHNSQPPDSLRLPRIFPRPHV